MFAALGILLLIVGGAMTFAVDRSVDGADTFAIGLILMGGGGLLILAAAIEATGFSSAYSEPTTVERHDASDEEPADEEIAEEARAA